MKINEKIETATEYALPPLPYAQNVLEPVISANTISFHYGKNIIDRLEFAADNLK